MPVERRDLPWGVVTNKLARFTEPLLSDLGLSARAGCVISGDTTAQAKPHPAPLLHACQTLGCPPARTAYVGDANKDTVAGRRAGVRVLVAMWGYLDPGDDPVRWGADALLDTPVALLEWLEAGED